MSGLGGHNAFSGPPRQDPYRVERIIRLMPNYDNSFHDTSHHRDLYPSRSASAHNYASLDYHEMTRATNPCSSGSGDRPPRTYTSMSMRPYSPPYMAESTSGKDEENLQKSSKDDRMIRQSTSIASTASRRAIAAKPPSAIRNSRSEGEGARQHRAGKEPIASLGEQRQRYLEAFVYLTEEQGYSREDAIKEIRRRLAEKSRPAEVEESEEDDVDDDDDDEDEDTDYDDEEEDDESRN